MIIKPAYYNENDKVAAQWLRNLIAQGHIAPGDVDERSIEDVQPDDLKSYAQCHFFAGIGVWSYALRRAGWPDSKQVWTGSCPCQPFSAAGKGTGFDDERHLWPAWLYLIDECRPPVILGEQVASKNAEPWIDLVHADLEVLDYAFGCVPFPSASVGAPHIRDRLYWVAISEHSGRQAGEQAWKWSGTALPPSAASGMANPSNQRQHGRGAGEASDGRDAARVQPERLRDAFRMENARGERRDGLAIRACRRGYQQGGAEAAGRGATHGLGHPNGERAGRNTRALRGAQAGEGRRHSDNDADPSGGIRGLADMQSLGRDRWEGLSEGCVDDRQIAERHEGFDGPTSVGQTGYGDGGPGPTNGFWSAADWLLCRDGKWRPVEPGTFPLAHGAPARVGRLRAYGNAINARAAQVFIEVVMDSMGYGDL